MDAVLVFLARLDWFERVGELARWLIGIRSWRFAVPRACGYSGEDIERLLRSKGVSLWGRSFNRQHLFFRVKLRQANWTEYLLWHNGIPVTSKPYNPRNRQAVAPSRQSSSRPTNGSGPMAWLDGLASLLDL